MNKELKIRRAQGSDALFLTSISFGAKRYAHYPKWHNELTITENYIEKNIVFVAEKNNTIIGYCSLRKDDEGDYWLDHLFIRPAYIKKGTGTKLIQEVIKYGRENKIEAVGILTDPNMKGFYEKAGAKFINDVESDVLEGKMSLFALIINSRKETVKEENPESSPISIAEFKEEINEFKQVSPNERIKLGKNTIKQKLHELDKEIEEEAEAGDEDLEIEEFKFTAPIGYKFQCEEEHEQAEKEIAVTVDFKETESEQGAALEEAGTAEGEIKEREGMAEETMEQSEELREEVKQILDRVTEEKKQQKRKIKHLSETGDEAAEESAVHIKTEKEKMLSGEQYIAWGDEMAEERKRARGLIKEFNLTDPEDKKQTNAILKDLFGAVGEYIHIEPDFKCHYGYNINIGDNFYAGYNCVILDNAKVTIGDNCIISPQVGIYTLAYPMNAARRMAGYEYAKPVTIGNNVWIGGGSIIGPGVTIGNDAVIVPGSVVMTDIPEGKIAGGNPAKIIKEADE